MHLFVLLVVVLAASAHAARKPADPEPNPTKWSQIRGTGTQISARGEIIPVWIINKHKELLRRDFTNGGWALEKDNVHHVGASFDESAWIVLGNSWKVQRGRGGLWTTVEDAPKLRQIAGRSYYEAIGVDNNEDIYHFIEEKWRKLPGKAVYAAIGIDGAIWVINREQSIFHWDWARNDWDVVEGKAVNVDVYNTHRVIVSNKDHDMFTWTGSNWKKEDAKCVQASITSNNIFCIRKKGAVDNEIYRN
ncbi:tectonin-2-like [Paramacrobiotus metropolitanus]|uniref:tectonin-2-like n=1 Tax=Paramacrobiotus metropolitanus TaxID=2943436 RepID=UPI0024459CA3|nr:tectonin-2-like [Paramacrobiotus metropolitanus]